MIKTFSCIFLGKALTLLTKEDIRSRAPGAGDILHNSLQLLLRDLTPRMPASPTLHSFVPPSPSHLQYSQMWPTNGSTELQSFHPYLSASTALTLSPPPSSDSLSGSPRHTEPPVAGISSSSSNNSGGSYHTSDEESAGDDRPSPQHSPVNLQLSPSTNSESRAPPPEPHYRVAPPPQQPPPTLSSYSNGHSEVQLSPEPAPKDNNHTHVPDPMETGSSKYPG